MSQVSVNNRVFKLYFRFGCFFVCHRRARVFVIASLVLRRSIDTFTDTGPQYWSEPFQSSIPPVISRDLFNKKMNFAGANFVL